MAGGRMTGSMRRAARLTNKTKLLICRGTESIQVDQAEEILWDTDSADAPKHHHVGAMGVETGEMLEHHLQAALSSSSLQHSQPARASSPSAKPSSDRDRKGDASSSNRNDVGGSSTGPGAALAYHIPTPDATGLVQNVDYAKLYQVHKYREHTHFIRFSDTVEESSGGWGGLGYCMDDEDERWLSTFNGKMEGSSGSAGGGASGAAEGKENMPLGATPSKGKKGKDKVEEKPAPLNISEDTFEFVMGVLEKYAEDEVPTLHTGETYEQDLSLLPTFATVERLFSASPPPAFFPSYEIPRGLPDPATLVRIARTVHTHWRARRERRKGKSIMPLLNYDETIDSDPYVCFRRRDIRATRKTRRTDNYSVEQMQRLQYELRDAHRLAQMTLERELKKKELIKSQKEVWEAKWKLYETKRRWPALGLTREEEEIITGKLTSASVSGTPGASGTGTLNPMSALSSSNPNVPRPSKKAAEREREKEAEREKQKAAAEAARAAEKAGQASAARLFSVEELKARIDARRAKVEEELARRKEADANWDDATDTSFLPLGYASGEYNFRPAASLDPHWSSRSSDEEDEPKSLTSSRPPSFRLRKGRDGVLHLDRRLNTATRRGPQPSTSNPFSYASYLFPNRLKTGGRSSRPTSIDEAEDVLSDDEPTRKRRRLNEIARYSSSHGGALGVGMGLDDDAEQVVVDDMETKYIRHRITLLHDSDLEKLRPDMTVLQQALAVIDAPEEQPPVPIVVRPQGANAQLVMQQHQQQMMQQQQMEQFQRFQIQAQQAAQLQAAQQAQQAQAQLQAQQAQMQMQQQQQQQQGQGQQQQGQQIAQPAAPGPGQQMQHQQNGGQMQGQGQNSNMPPPNVNGNGNVPPPQGLQTPGQPPNGRQPIKRPPSAASNGSANGNGSMPPPAHPRPSMSPANNLQPPLPPHMHASPQMNGMGLPASKNGTPQQAPQQLPPQAGFSPQMGGNVPMPLPGMDPAMQQHIFNQRQQYMQNIQLHKNQAHAQMQAQIQAQAQAAAQAQAQGQGQMAMQGMQGLPGMQNMQGMQGMAGMQGQGQGQGQGMPNMPGFQGFDMNDPNTVAMIQAFVQQQQQQQQFQQNQQQPPQQQMPMQIQMPMQGQQTTPMQMPQQLPNGINGVNGNGNGNVNANGNGNANGNAQTDIETLKQQAAAAGFPSIHAFVQHRKQALTQRAQQQANGTEQGANAVAGANGITSQAKGNGNGNGNGNGVANAGATSNGANPAHGFAGSPQLQNTQMQLKLPARAAQRLAEKAQTGPAAQRA